MEGNQSINSEAKWIADHAGIKHGNIINITAMEDGMKDTDVLWKYLASLSYTTSNGQDIAIKNE